MNKELIMKRLMAGEDAQAIADEVAKLLNDAVKDYEALKEMGEKKRLEEEARAKAEAELKARGNELLEHALDYIDAYVELAHPEVVGEINPMTVDELREVVDQSIPLLKLGKNVKNMTIKTGAEADRIINEFLKSFKLI